MLTNHIAILLDRSSSMKGIRYEVVKQFNAQVQTMREKSLESGQRTLVSLYTFANHADSALIFARNVDAVKELRDDEYQPNGSTAMFDSIGKAVTELRNVPGANDDETSFLIIVITDGEENWSTKFSASSLNVLMQSVVASDRWSFAFLVPRSGLRVLQNFGIPAGNIQPWEATVRGVEISSNQTASSLGNYYTMRSAGVKSTRSFFSPNMAGISPEELKRKLVDVSTKYFRLAITKDTRIDEFVKATTGNTYVRGNGLFQLTKTEDVQDYKKLVIQDRRTNVLYGGNSEGSVEVRRVLGMPENGTIAVKPGNHMEYNIYVQSTSVNRKLINGTTLLLET